MGKILSISHLQIRIPRVKKKLEGSREYWSLKRNFLSLSTDLDKDLQWNTFQICMVYISQLCQELLSHGWILCFWNFLKFVFGLQKIWSINICLMHSRKSIPAQKLLLTVLRLSIKCHQAFFSTVSCTARRKVIQHSRVSLGSHLVAPLVLLVNSTLAAFITGKLLSVVDSLTRPLMWVTQWCLIRDFSLRIFFLLGFHWTYHPSWETRYSSVLLTP